MIHVTDNNFKSTKFTYIKLMHNGDISIYITYTQVKSYTVCDGQTISSSFIRQMTATILSMHLKVDNENNTAKTLKVKSI